MLPEEPDHRIAGIVALRRAREIVKAVAQTIEDMQRGIDSRLRKRAVRADRGTEVERAGPGDEQRRGKLRSELERRSLTAAFASVVDVLSVGNRAIGISENGRVNRSSRELRKLSTAFL